MKDLRDLKDVSIHDVQPICRLVECQPRADSSKVDVIHSPKWPILGKNQRRTLLRQPNYKLLRKGAVSRVECSVADPEVPCRLVKSQSSAESSTGVSADKKHPHP